MTFVFEIISFLIIMFVMYKWVLPPINQAMTERQEKIKAQFDEAAKLKAEAEATEKEHQEQLADARAEASRIREEAREQGAQIIAQHREQAQVEAERITTNAHAQIEVERAQALSQLKGEVGAIATTLAGRIVGEVPRRRRSSEALRRAVHRRARGRRPKESRRRLMAQRMRGVSAGSLAEVLEAVENSTGTLSTVGDELFSVAAVLDATPSVRRVLTDPATEPDARSGLAAAVLGDKIDVATLGIVDVAAQHRWAVGTRPQRRHRARRPGRARGRGRQERLARRAGERAVRGPAPHRRSRASCAASSPTARSRPSTRAP